MLAFMFTFQLTGLNHQGVPAWPSQVMAALAEVEAKAVSAAMRAGVIRN